MIKDHVSAEATPVFSGVKEAVDHRQSVPQEVRQGTTDQVAWFSVVPGAAILDDLRIDGCFLDHRHIVEQPHVGHPAAGVARVEIGSKERELFTRRLGYYLAAYEIEVAPR